MPPEKELINNGGIGPPKGTQGAIDGLCTIPIRVRKDTARQRHCQLLRFVPQSGQKLPVTVLPQLGQIQSAAGFFVPQLGQKFPVTA